MSGFLKAGSLLALLASASATPIVQRSQRTHHDSTFKLPKTYAALGDSFAAGLGSGFFLNNSADASDIQCLRQDGAYPAQILEALPFLLAPGQPFDFTACSGDLLDDIDGQIAKLTGRKFDLLTLTIGGNDFGFADIALNCAYAVISPGVDAQSVCDASLDTGFAAIADQANWEKFDQKLDLIRKNALAPGGHLFVTGYGKFFDDPIKGDACDQISFFPIVELAALNITTANRLRANQLTDLINEGIIKSVKKAGDDVHFVDFDRVFEGKRFCEQDNAADPIGANNANVFYNDLTTILPTPGVAPLDKQTPGLTGVDITDLLQQASVFHPKGRAPHFGLVVDIVFRILIDAIQDALVGPQKYCSGQKCWDIPEKCASVRQDYTSAPTVWCESGESYPAKSV